MGKNGFTNKVVTIRKAEVRVEGKGAGPWKSRYVSNGGTPLSGRMRVPSLRRLLASVYAWHRGGSVVTIACKAQTVL